MEPVIQGLTLVFDPFNIALVFGGVLIGVTVGALPGLSSPMAVALLLPFTITLDPVPAICMMAALYCAGTFGGSITAILINAPGAPPAAATALDGYPMAKRGEAGRALGLAAVSSVLGGVFSLIIFLFAAPLLAKLALKFRPPEYFALTVFALSMLASISGKSSLRNLIAGAFGVLIGTAGIHLTTGVERFTFGIYELTEGVSFVPVLIGLFALGELLGQSQVLNVAYERITSIVIKLPSREDFRRVRWTILRSSGIGTFIGILPAEGATVAAIMGYNEAKRWSKNKEEFGHGALEGIAGPEAANNAACTGSFVPLLTLGIPGSGTTAILLGALIALNVAPGPGLMTDRPEVFWSVIISMYIGNLVLLMLNLPLIPYIARLLAVSRNYLVPFVLFFALIGSYIGQNNPTELLIMIALGVLATVFRFTGFPLPPLIIGFILGGMMEDNLGRAIRRSGGLEFLWERPMTLALVILALVLLVAPYLVDKLKIRDRLMSN